MATRRPHKQLYICALATNDIKRGEVEAGMAAVRWHGHTRDLERAGRRAAGE